MVQLLLCIRIPAANVLPGDRPSMYRKLVDWPVVPRQGDVLHVGNIQTDVDRVWFRSDGRPEIHVQQLPELSGPDVSPQEFLQEVDVFCDELVMQGFTERTAWDVNVDDTFGGPNG